MTTAPDRGTPRGAWPWDELVRELWPRLRVLAHRRYGLSAEDAGDVLQHVALEILRRRPRPKSPRAFFTTAFKRRCLDFHRNRKPGRALAESDRTADPRGQLVDVTTLHVGLSRLSPRCRELITRYALEGRTLPETASVTALPPSSLWFRVNRCLGRLRECLT